MKILNKIEIFFENLTKIEIFSKFSKKNRYVPENLTKIEIFPKI